MRELLLVPEELSLLGNSNYLNEISLWMEKEYPILENNYSFYTCVCVCARALSQLFGDYSLFFYETKNWREGSVPKRFLRYPA